MIDINKKYRTRDGREVRIYATDGHPSEPVHGAFQDYSCAWNSSIWNHDGTNIYGKRDADLIEVKPRVKQRVWINVYPDHCLGAYHEKKDADEQAAPHRIGCVQVEIDCEEGEGL
jgi:hypothetical protein